MKNLELEEFNMRSLKYLNGKVTISYSYNRVVDGEPHTFLDSPESTVIPHPAFMAVLTGLKDDLAGVFFNSEIKDDMVKKLRVNGISVTGSEGARKVKILGMIEDISGSAVSLNSAWLSIDGDGYFANNSSLIDNVNQGIIRAYNYIFKDEKAQLDIPFNEAGEMNEIEKVEKDDKPVKKGKGK